jgi:phage terminase small subunit
MANHPHNTKRPAKAKTLKAVEDGDIEALYESLTIRQRRFCEEYVVDYDGRAAAMRAGYATKWADRQASNLLKNQGVTKYVDFLTQSKIAKIVSVDPDYIIQQVILIIGKPGAKDSDRLRGLELLARHLGMFTEKVELTGRDGGPLETKKIEEDAQAFTQLLKSLSEKSRASNDVSVSNDGKGLQRQDTRPDRTD